MLIPDVISNTLIISAGRLLRLKSSLSSGIVSKLKYANFSKHASPNFLNAHDLPTWRAPCITNGFLEEDVNPDDFVAYQVEYDEYSGSNGAVSLVCSGRTLYNDMYDVGLTLTTGAPVVVIQIVEDEEGKLSRSIEEYTTIAAALNALQDKGADFVGTVAAKLNDRGTAEWLVISSANVLTYEKKGSQDPVKADYKFATLTPSVDGGAITLAATYTDGLGEWVAASGKVEYSVSVNGGAKRTFTADLTAGAKLPTSLTIPGLAVANGSNIDVEVLLTFTGNDNNTYTVSGSAYIA